MHFNFIKFEHTKGVIESRNSENRQYHGKTKQVKMANNGPLNSTQKTNNRTTKPSRNRG